MTDLPRCTVPDGAVTTGAQWQQQHPTWLYRAVGAGAITDRDETQAWPVTLHGLGTIPVPDGRLVACDPYLADADQAAFTDAVPAGEHEVRVAVAEVGPDHRRVLAALVLFATPDVTSWRLAATAGGPDVAGLSVGEYVGYGVDAGTGCLASASAMAAVAEVLGEDAGMLEDPLSEALDSSPIDAAVAAPGPGLPRVAVFTSGWGDGLYPTWFGLDAAGAVVLAMTDFLVATDPYLE